MATTLNTNNGTLDSSGDAEFTQLETIVVGADQDRSGNEEFIINDIQMGISPSDIQVFDDNYVQEQSFLRTNSVYCFRSKYSDTKIVMNFPFQIGPMAPGSDNNNHTFNCLKLIAELNAYPYCFIKNSRIRTYISPRQVSSTGYLMFAVEELAIVQAAAASNLLFLEVTLRYFNHAPLTADFLFVSNQVATASSTYAINEDEYVQYERDMLKFVTPLKVNDLSSSSVWADYVDPKIKRLLKELYEDTDVLKDYSTKDTSTHPGLDVKLFLPLVLSNAAKGEKLMQESDGSLVGPGSKVIITTDIEPIDSLALPDQLIKAFNQNFETDEDTGDAPQGETKEEEAKRIKAERLGLTYKKKIEPVKGSVVNPLNTENADTDFINEVSPGSYAENGEKRTNEGSIRSGAKELFIQYSGASLAQLGMAVQKIEIRRSNILVSQKIGSYKHPIVQYMGRNPARTVVHFVNNSEGVFDDADAAGMTSFFSNALQVLDENRTLFPEAEAYNHVKIQSLGSILLGAKSGLPNQTSISATAERAGVESLIYTFTETNTEKFLEQLTVEASGARSISKASGELTHIVMNWLEAFHEKLRTVSSFKNLATDQVIVDDTLKIYSVVVKCIASMITELGYTGGLDYMTSNLVAKVSSETLEETTVLDTYITSKNPSSGITPMLISLNPDDIKLTDTEIARPLKESVTDTSWIPTDYIRYLADVIESMWIIGPKVSEDIKKNEKIAILSKSGLAKPYKQTVFQLMKWFSGYACIIMRGRIDMVDGKPTNLKNVKFSRSPSTESLLMQAASMIDATSKSNPISIAGLTETQRHFLTNLADIYTGSLYGQNIEDIYLEDLDADYSIEKDVIIQNTDPFFFLSSEDMLGDEMAEFYNKSYGEEKLNPSINLEEDIESHNKVTQTEIALGLDVSKRKLREVDFNADTAVYFEGEPQSINVNTTDIASVIRANSDARAAIENSLKKYGLAGDSEFRDYMYKVAYIESGFGTKLTNGSGARGLFQNQFWAPAQIMMGNNKVFAGKGWQNMSQSDARSTAKTLVLNTPGFAQDHELSADIFIEYFLINGKKHPHPVTKKFDEALTFAYHNLGPTIAVKGIEEYLVTKRNTTSSEAIEAFKGQKVSSSQEWYSTFSNKFASINLHALQGAGEVAQSAVEKKTILQTSKDASQSSSQWGTTEKPKLFETKKNQSALIKQQTSVTKANEQTKSSKSSAFERVGQTLSGTVKDVLDGDTVDVAFVVSGVQYIHRIRLAGVDTKESFDNYKSSTDTKDWAELAKKELSNMVLTGKPVKVNYIDIDAIQSTTGKIRLVGVITNSAGKDVSLELIKKGLGDVSQVYNTNKTYSQALVEAQKNEVGFWSKLTVKKYEEIKANGGAKYKQAANQISDGEILKGATTGAANYNTWVPFTDNKDHKVTSVFTYGRDRTDVNTGRPHNGLDLRGDPGDTVVSAAAGSVIVRGPDENAGGLRVYVDHGNGFETRYMHLSKALVKSGQKVSANEPIGQVGGTGKKGSKGYTPHLHYEVLFKGRYIHPFSTKYPLSSYTSGMIYEGEGSVNMSNGGTSGGPFMPLAYSLRNGITEENTVYNENHLATAIFQNAQAQVNMGFKAAMPAIKVYITYGNENDGLGLDTLLSGTQYYELKGVQSFKMVCNNTDTPVDTAIMTIVDPSFGNTDAWTSVSLAPQVQYDKIGTDYEMQYKFNRLLLRPGTKIQVRLGYGNDPNQLDIVFNGGIMEMSSNAGTSQIVTLLLEGYGRELLQEIKNPVEPAPLDNDHHSPTTVVLGKSLISKPVDHFGYTSNHIRWAFKTNDTNDPEARNMVKGFWNEGSFAYFNTSPAIHRSRLYMNIFAPEIEVVDDEFANYWSSFGGSIGFSSHQFGYPFYVHRMTPWDCCKQMEYRHPGTMFKPMMFEDRMTLFYGVKEQMYFARDLSRYSLVEVARRLGEGSKDNTTRGYYERRRERMEPVSNIHMVSSSNNLISNMITLNGQWSTCTTVSYFTDNSDFNNYWDWKPMRMEVDDNLLPWEIREKELKLSGTHGEYTSFLYGTADLKKEAEKMYDGSIIIRGNSKMKTGDYIFIDDVENRMSGLALVRNCIQHFDPVNGFVTEITPGMYVEPAQFMYTSLWLQLMAAFKVGSSKIRLIASSSFTSEFNMIKEYLNTMKQLELGMMEGGDTNSTTVQSTAYFGAVTLAAYLSYSMASMLGLKHRIPGVHAVKFSYYTLKALFSNAAIKTARNRVKLIKEKEWYKKGSEFSSRNYTSAKTKVLGTNAYKKLAESKIARFAGGVRRSLLVRSVAKPTLAVARFAMAATLRAGFAMMSALSLTNPFGILIDVVLMLVMSWAYAKVEKSDMTRQPLLFFPLIRHGKPYQAGMTGAIRNSYTESLKTEFDKTFNQLSKAAAIFEGVSASNNKDTPYLVSLLAPYARKKQAEQNIKNYVMTNAGQTNDYVKGQSAAEIQEAIDSKAETQKQIMEDKKK